MNINFKKRKNNIYTWIRIRKFSYCIIVEKNNNLFDMFIKKKYRKKNSSPIIKDRGELTWLWDEFIICDENKCIKNILNRYNYYDRFFQEKGLIKELMRKANESLNTKLYFWL